MIVVLKGQTAVSLYAMSLKNSRLFGKIINSSQTGYPIAKSLVFLKKKLIFHMAYDINITCEVDR
jgi:hypothetical protein